MLVALKLKIEGEVCLIIETIWFWTSLSFIIWATSYCPLEYDESQAF